MFISVRKAEFMKIWKPTSRRHWFGVGGVVVVLALAGAGIAFHDELPGLSTESGSEQPDAKPSPTPASGARSSQAPALTFSLAALG